MGSSLLTGEKGEIAVCEYLTQKGYRVLDKNYHSRYGEIDIVAVNDGTIIFIEVKTRKPSDISSGLWSITKSKQNKIIKTALVYLQNKSLDAAIRFDAAVVSCFNDNFNIDYYENAFDATDF